MNVVGNYKPGRVTDTVQRTYTYGTNRIDQTQIIAGAWQPNFYGYDGAGSVRLLTDATGTVTDTYDYDAFGNVINLTGHTPNNYLYRGEQFDSDLGLYYLRARYYNAATGRFLTRDSYSGDVFDPPSLHKYLYATGNPVNMFDPSGRLGVGDGGPTTLTPPATSNPTTASNDRNGGGGGDIIEYALLLGFTASVEGLVDPSFKNITQTIRCIWSLVDSLLSLARDQEYGEATREGCTFKIRRPRGKCPKGQQLEDHHLLPFKFGYWFKQQQCDIEDPTQHRCCPDSVHDEIHAAGWNKAWQFFID